MEHRFTGPSYTLGIEEELMIVDEETLDLSNSIERLLADLNDVPTEGAKPLLARYRAATRAEREWITGVLREHCAEWFPDVKVP